MEEVSMTENGRWDRALQSSSLEGCCPLGGEERLGVEGGGVHKELNSVPQVVQLLLTSKS